MSTRRSDSESRLPQNHSAGRPCIVLPPSVTSHGPGRWVVLPAMARDWLWLPRLSDVLCAAWQAVAV
jgi:hypothetical protein